MSSTVYSDSVRAATRLASRSTTSWLNSWHASATVGLRYWAGALARGATPLDVAADSARWLELVTTRRPPDWSTANEVVHASPLMALRDFSVRGPGDPTPTLVLPPQAGHHSCIVDYSETQSQVRTALEAGLTRLYVLEWLGATGETRNASITDYLACVEDVVGRIGGPVNLVGDCQGGWLAAIYAALHPAHVATLTVAGAPIDAHAGDSAIADYVRLGGGMTPYRLAVELGGGVLDGDVMLRGFVALQPETELATHAELVLHLDDLAYVERYGAFRDWYEHTQPIPGAMYLWAVEHLFLRNELARDRLSIGGRRVSLAAIDCPVHLLAGAEDHITPPQQVFALAEHVSSPEVTTSLTSGGHLGLFMGRDALRTAWQPLFERLAA